MKCACGCGQEITPGAKWSRGHHRRGVGGFSALAESSKAVDSHELGTAGTPFYAGQFQPDRINEEWNDIETRYDRLEKMEKTDSACAALFKAVTLPIRSVKWWVEPASDSNEDKKIADSITWNLVDGMTYGFDSFLSEALTCVSRGFSLFEKVFEEADAEEFTGTIKWKKFAFRSQRTIDEWDVDSKGSVKRVHQDFGEGEHSVRVWMPIEKLLIFTYQKEGNNYLGDPLFRACWRDYYYLDGLERIEAIGLERFWIGIPWIQLPKNATTSDKDTAFDIVKKIRGDEASGLVTADSWVFDILRVATEGGAMTEVIGRYRRNIFLTGLAQFLALGDKSVGSWALSKDQSTFFLFALNSVADSVLAEIMNKHAIPQLVKMNWPRVTKFPKLTHDDIEQIDIGAFAVNMGKFVETGYLTSPDTNIEEQVREMMGLPEMTDEQRKNALKAEMQPKVDLTKKEKPGEEGKKTPTEEVQETEEDTENAAALAEIPPYFLETVLVKEDEKALAIIDFNRKAPEFAGIFEATV